MDRRVFPILRAAFAVPLALLLLTGCGAGPGIYGNYRAIEELQTVETLGIDRDADGRVTVTAAVGRSADGSTGSAVLCRSGAGIPEALEALQDYTERGQLFFAHVRYLLLGQEMAESGLGEVFDYIERDVQTRMSTELFVLRDSRAEALLGALADGERAAGLLASVRRDTEVHGGSHTDTVRAAAVALAEYGAAAVCALRTVPTEGSILSDAPELTALPDGYAVLSDGALAGFLDGGTAEALSLLTGHLGTVSRSVPDGSGGTVTLELSGSAAVSPAEAGLTEITLHLSAVIAGAEPDAGPVTDGDTLNALSSGASAQWEADVSALLDALREMDAPLPVLARPAGLRRGGAPLPPHWLRTMEYRVTAEMELVHSCDLGEPLRTEGRP